MRVVETQDRGALHLHVLLWSPVRLDPHTVQGKALAAGFGCVFELDPLDAQKHAYYVSKYVTKAADSRDDIPWRADVVDRETGEIYRGHTVASYRTWSSSRDWGVTMAMIRAAVASARRAAAEHVQAVPVSPLAGASSVFESSGEPQPPP